MRGQRSIVVGLVLFALGSLVLLKTWHYYGHVLWGWDAQFYYAQARALVFEGKLDMTDALQTTAWPEPFQPDQHGYFTKPPRSGLRIINKYPIGLSLMEAPLLLAGQALATLFGHEAEASGPPGTSPVAMAAVAFGLLLYTVIGLALLHRLLEHYYHFWPATIGIFAAWIGTSLFYYSAVFPFMAHGTAFALVVAILWQIDGIRSCTQPSLVRFSLLAATFGFLFLVRPQQILLLPICLPFLAGSIDRSSAGRILTTVCAAGVLIAVCGIQVLANYYQLGALSLNAYAAGDEGFHWLDPHLITVAFSASRGLLWMSPIVIIAGLGMFKPWRWLEYVVLAHGLVQLYVIACWSSPDQGDSFGCRMWTECTPLVAVGLAKLFDRLGPSSRWVVSIACVLALSWTMALMALYMTGSLGFTLNHSDILEKLTHLGRRDL